MAHQRQHDNWVSDAAREISAVVARQTKDYESVRKDIVKVMSDLVVDFASDGYRIVNVSYEYHSFYFTSVDKTKFKSLGPLGFVPSIWKPISEISRKTMYHGFAYDSVIDKLILPIIMATIEASFPAGFNKLDGGKFQISF
jgi:hypothetical protein